MIEEGTRQGHLVIGKRFRKNNRTYYHCVCDCENELDILESNLIGKHYQSCKCRGKYVSVDDVYDDLKVVKKIDNKHWQCRCVCGNFVELTSPELLRGNNKSCGCRRSQWRSAIRSDSSTKVTGVCYNNRRSKYIAYINKKGKRYNLGYFDTLELAKIAREDAEKDLLNEETV